MKFDYDELYILFVEVEGMLNFRLLIYVFLDDVEELLIFFYLIYGRGILFLFEVMLVREVLLN